MALVACWRPVLAGCLPRGACRPRTTSSTFRRARTTSIKIAKGKPKTIKTNVPFYEIVIGDPEIANVNPLTDNSFYVLGNNLGTTGIALFDENKQLVGTHGHRGDARHRPAGQHHPRQRARRRHRGSRRTAGWCCPARPKMRSPPTRPSKIATRFSGEEEVINSVNISSSQQVQLNVRFVEINRAGRPGTRHQDRRAYLGTNGGISFNSDPIAEQLAPAGR